MLFLLSSFAAAAAAASETVGAGRGSPHLKYMSYYGFNPPLMHGWVNMGLEAGLGGFSPIITSGPRQTMSQSLT